MYQSTTPHSQPPSLPSFGLRVRVHAWLHTAQRTLFTGDDENAGKVVQLAEDLAIVVSRIIFRDFKMRSHLEVSVPAVLRNVRMGFWALARRAATDVSGLLSFAARKYFGPRDACIQAANLALSVAAACDAALRRVSRQRSPQERYRESVREELRNARRRYQPASYEDYMDYLHEESGRVR